MLKWAAVRLRHSNASRCPTHHEEREPNSDQEKRHDIHLSNSDTRMAYAGSRQCARRFEGMSRRRRRDVYVIETNADLQVAVEKIRQLSGDHAYIYMPHRAKQLGLADVIDSGSGLKVLPYETINANIDDRLYGFAQAISQNLSKVKVEKHLQWAFFVSLQDAIVARIRPVMQLAEYRKQRNDLGQIFWVPNDPPRHTQLWESLATVMPDAKVAGGLMPPVKSSIEAALKVVGAGKRRSLNPEQVERALKKKGAVCVTCALGDPQYRNTILPFVSRMLKRRHVILIPSASLGDEKLAPYLTEHKLDTYIRSGKLTILDRTDALPISPVDWDTVVKLSKASRRLSSPLPEFEDWEPTYGALARDIALAEATRVAGECRLLWQQLERIARISSVVVVCPGRPMRSTLLVAAARSVNRRTIEIQSGTIAKTRRFVAPQADKVLVMDEESRETYAHLGRTDGVEIVGSIRLDYDLDKYRSISRDDAREKIGFPPDRDLWTLASQPIGVDAMRQIAAVVFEAARRCGASVMVKMHPNETPDYERAYLEVGKRCKGANIIVERKISSVLAAIASDMVLTHFSTVGIEAFALNKMTVVVNPFDERPTFDLVKMNMAYEARNADELFRIASDRVANELPKNELTDGKVLARCEYWVKKMQVAGGFSGPTQALNGTRVELTMKRIWRRLPSRMQRTLQPVARAVRARLLPPE